MHLNDLLIKAGLDPRGVLVLRHRPHETGLRKALLWIAGERPGMFNSYQSTHGERVEGSMARSAYVASFIGHAAGQAVFVGLYRMKGHRPLTYDQFWTMPDFRELKKHGMLGFEGGREHILFFDLERTNHYADWSGRLVVRWPPPERAWFRWADKNEIPVHAIHEQSLFDKDMPDWRELVVNWADLAIMPTKWRNALAHWRGIYFILDVSDGKGYVGSAYGAENILSRWQSYAVTGHGGNKALRLRLPENLRFSILQRVSPDLPAEDVIALEGTWKARLHTRRNGLNEN